MAKDSSQPNLTYPFKVTLLVAGLVALLGLATSLTVNMVQLQAAASAYLSGLSVWNQAQIGAVHSLSRYAQYGDEADLLRAREYLVIPLSDREGRLYMEAQAPGDQITQAFVRGGNHPDDVALMVWLYEDFGELGALQRAFSVWRDSDRYILTLTDIADQLEGHWQNPTDDQYLQQLDQNLNQTNIELQQLAADFRRVMTDTSRWLTETLTLASIIFFIVFALLASWLIWRLVNLLQGAQRQFQAIFEQAAVGILHLDNKGVITRANPAIAEILHRESPDLKGHSLQNLIHPEDWSLDKSQRDALAQGELSRFTVEQRLMRSQNRVLWARLTYSRAHDARESVVIVEDISESRRLSKELSFQATHDALTGLYNRRAFERRLTDSLKRARAESTQHSLCFIDLDQFKVVNDTSGHFAGDRLLQQVVDVFRRELRDCDMLARLGGDEFAMILENCPLDVAGRITEKLRAALEEFHFAWDGNSYNISCSVGVVSISANDKDTESIMRAADIACYLAKEKGRNRVYVSRDDDQHQRQREGEMNWLGRIRDAMNSDRLFLDAQKIIPIQQQDDSISYEVLVRLKDETGKVVPPSAFLPAAERFGVANQIDRWVIDKTLSLLAAHPLHVQRLYKCHINLSGVSLDQPDFYTYVAECFQRYAVPPEKICFEITETAAVNNLLDAIALMESLGKIGCSFALDDFGTGLSSFSYLRRLPVDTLKIDGVFVRDIVADKTDLAMVRAINEVGQTLGKYTIAEFVENDASLQVLKTMGVDAAQGYGLHKPACFLELLKDTNTEPVA
ncbi:bifunctional diguanylate cyclase/phosphodiesterase [Gilvimarinus sp. DA14]|uniref:putative bifunctional diguanylate cyclase/phosphodiesterase n=1 Tax=Gilvimarinus sp. DA14 TaxID=2956798 RepID=UPI0020B8D5C8|nr:EAL domain-containing protein [Gilvimarinus sp. DA14]UTF58943.1 EAL domain-containing protein [Gilvimarinus sp. DA14]